MTTEETPRPDLSHARVAVLVGEGFHDEQVLETLRVLREHGARVVPLGLNRETVSGSLQAEVEVEATLAEESPDEFSLVMIPGGPAAERLRVEDAVLTFVRRTLESGRSLAAIEHGLQVLISARVLPGRLVTAAPGIRDDVRLTGARVRDAAVLTDGPLLTGRSAADLPAFLRAIVDHLAAPVEETATS